ncbi:MAG: hypothetical protein AAGI54_14395, partial [Planctomycetota bacterium]
MLTLPAFGNEPLAQAATDMMGAQSDSQGVVDTGREWPGLPNSKPIWAWERLAGDWAGVREDLEAAGVAFGAEYIAEWSGVLDGGVSQAGSFRNLLTADLTFDTEALIGLPGGTAF